MGPPDVPASNAPALDTPALDASALDAPIPAPALAPTYTNELFK